MPDLPKGDIKDLTPDEELGVITHYLQSARANKADSRVIEYFESLYEKAITTTSNG